MAVGGKPLRIGKYDVVAVLGEGGMGAVYKAVDPRIGRTVAIKVIKGDFAHDAELRRRFDIEARAVGNLQHPNIVTVYDFGEENGSPYLVMQYLDGTPLDKIIAQRHNLPIIQKLGIIIEVLRALDYAHEHGVIHRDVKPANVHLLKDGSVKLLDFGIAREGNLAQTKTGQVIGTMFYMPPEQMNGEVVDRRGDIFSTGVMLFELLTFSLPFDAKDQTAIIVQRLRGDPPPPLSKYFDNHPTEMDDIIARAMMRDRDERYARAEDFAFDLLRVEERLKRDMAVHKVDQARALIAKSDLLKAKELLSEVIKIDTQNSTAKQLLYEVQQSLQAQQRLEKMQQLRHQAEGALSAKHLDEAADMVEQAIRIDKSDLELLELRAKVQEAKSRAQQVKKLLNFAIAAQQSEQFEVAQKAIADALTLDPTDTDAKVMQAAVARQMVEQEKRNRVVQLLQVARREISQRQYDAARANIDKAREIDPTHPEIPGLEKMAAAGEEQEKRRFELERLCAEIECRLLDANVTAARDLANTALRKFPGEERLVRLKAAADEAFEKEERKKFVDQHIASASRLVDDGQASNALKLLEDAAQVYPTETRLHEYLKIVRETAAREAAEHEKKEILLRARSAIRRRSYDEAIETLENGQLQFPSDAEIHDLLEASRQELQRFNQKRQVEEVTLQARTLLESRAYTDAISLLERTVAQVSDPDLVGLLEQARQEGARYRGEVQRANEQATQMLDKGRVSDALKFLETQVATYPKNAEFRVLLDQARRLAGEAQQAKQELENQLFERAQAVIDDDWPTAEAMTNEALDLDPTSARARSLRAHVLDRKREEFVADCALRAWRLQAAEDVEGAAAEVEKGLAMYPAEPRLTMLRDSLKKEISQSQRRETRAGDLEQLRALQRNAERSTNPEDLRSISERTRNLVVRYPSEADIQSIAREVDRIVKARGGPAPGHGPVPSTFLERLRKRLTPFGEGKGRELKHQRMAKTKVFEIEVRNRKEAPIQDPSREVGGFIHEVGRKTLSFARPAGKWSAMRLGAVSVSIVLIAVIGYLMARTPSIGKKPVIKPEETRYVHIRANPADSKITSDGKPVTDGIAVSGATVEVSHLGYKTKRAQVWQEADSKIALEPEPVHLSIQTSAKSATAELDGQRISDLIDGSVDEFSLTPDGNSHKLTVIGKGRQLFVVDFQAVPGSRPQVTALNANDVFVVTSLGNTANVYGGNLLTSVRIGDQTVPVLPSGTDLDLTEQNREISFGEGNHQGSLVIDISNTPALAVHSITTEGQLMITANAERASLTVDGATVQRQKPPWLITGLVGSHTFVVSANGYQTQQWTMTLPRGQTLRKRVVLVPGVQSPALPVIEVKNGTPGSDVYVDGELKGQIDAMGKLIIPVQAGKHTVAISKPGYKSKVVTDIPVSNHVLFPNSALTPTPP